MRTRSEMRIWDQYAKEALGSLLLNPAVLAPDPMCGFSLVNSVPRDIAEYAADFADLMLEERDKRLGGGE